MSNLSRVLVAALGAALIAGCTSNHDPRYGKGNDHQPMNSYDEETSKEVVYVRPVQPVPQPTVVYVQPAPVVQAVPVYTYTTTTPVVRAVPVTRYHVYTN